MTETNEMSAPREMNTWVVRVGYDGSERRIRFRGIELCEASTHTVQGGNQNRWHEYTLYQTARGYRIYDQYITQWQGESGHRTLSGVLGANAIASDYPALANEAVRLGVLSADDVTTDASDDVEE